LGEEIVLGIVDSSCYWIPLILGIVAGVIAFCCFLFEVKDAKKKIIIFVILCALLLGGARLVGEKYDQPKRDVNYEKVLSQLQPIEEAYKNHAFYLKESVSEPGIQGEIKGSFGGSFLLVGGNIYGRVDSGRVITIVYEDNDPYIDHYIGVHRSVSFPLDEAVIITIPSGEQPYLMYPEVDIFKYRKVQENFGSELRLIPGAPHLYLPEGWEIL